MLKNQWRLVPHAEPVFKSNLNPTIWHFDFYENDGSTFFFSESGLKIWAAHITVITIFYLIITPGTSKIKRLGQINIKYEFDIWHFSNSGRDGGQVTMTSSWTPTIVTYWCFTVFSKLPYKNQLIIEGFMPILLIFKQLTNILLTLVQQFLLCAE